MPILRNFASPAKISSKKIGGGGGDPDFFAGAMETTWGWGSNNGGISTNTLITDGSTTDEINSPSQASYAAVHKFKAIFLGNGDNNAFGIKANSPPDDGGTLWGWGGNGNGQLGTGDSTARTSPVQVGARTDWKKVALGANGYAHFLTTDGTLFACGYNLTWTMLGDGTNTTRSSLVQIGTGYFDIANGDSHSIASKSDGTLLSWGRHGTQLGDTSVFNFTGTFNDGQASRNAPSQVGSGGFNSVMARDGRGGAAKSDGYLYGWGGAFGSNALPSTAFTAAGTGWSNAKIAAGPQSAVSVEAIIKSDGTLWMSGTNTQGQLGQGNTTSFSSPKQVGTNTNWFSVTAMINSVFATTTDRKMFSWGENTSGVLAVGDSTNRSSPTQVGTKKRWGLVVSKTTGSSIDAAGTTVLALSAVVA